jgi:hypothetical protein
MPSNAQLFVKRVARDDKFIADMESEITKFLDEVDAKFKTLQSKLGA